MNKRERVEAVYKLQPADRIPFVPAIYEHKGALVGKSPSAICRSAEYLYRGLREELAIYDPDMLVIGIDVYNVEAEALGCRVVYFEDSNDCPGIAEPIVNSAADLTKLHIPEPQRDGRMPLYLGVARQLQAELGGEMILRGAVTGPYSMAAQLIGAENFVLLTIEDPRFARQALEFCARVAAEFGRAFLKLGVEPIVFDSRATPVLARRFGGCATGASRRRSALARKRGCAPGESRASLRGPPTGCRDPERMQCASGPAARLRRRGL